MDKFVNWGSETPEQMEIRRKYEEDMREAAINRFILEARQTANQAATAALAGGGGGETLPSNSIEFVIDALYGQGFGVSELAVSGTVNVTINWGDGTEETIEIASDDSFSNTYLQRAEPYVCRISFDDISLVTSLYVSNNSANVMEARGLQNLVNLEYLEMDNNSLTSVDVSGMVNLIDLDVSDCNVPGGGPKSLTSVNVTGCTALQRLELDDSDFSEGLPNFTGLTNLTYLDLDQCELSGVIDLSMLDSLEYADLSGNTGITSVTLPESPINDLNIANAALTETAVNSILQSLDDSGITGGYVNLSGGTSAWPTGAGETAKTNLEGNGWTVNVNEPPPASIGIAASSDFNIVGNFTIEMFINLDNTIGNQRPYSFGTYPAANAISIEGGGSNIYFWANNSNTLSASYTFNTGQWYHICIMRSGGALGMYIDGTRVANTTYSDDIPSQGLPLTIGYGNEGSSEFNGKLSNFRWTSSAEYSTGSFTKPSSPLSVVPMQTKLLIFQGTNLGALLLDNSGNNRTATNSGATFSSDDPFNGPQGSLQV